MSENSLLGNLGCTVHMAWVVVATCCVVMLIVASCGTYLEIQESKAMLDCVSRNGMYEGHGDWVRCTEVQK